MKETKNGRYLLKKIRSSYILKKIFSFIYVNHKLDIIIYNKELQNKCGLDLEYYKFISQKYRTFEPNGIIKEFSKSTNNLIFQGKYINHRKEGEGIEFYENEEGKEKMREKFHGLYSKGYKIIGTGYTIRKQKYFFLIDNKGEEFFYNEKLCFKGDYFNGRRWNGIGYNYQGEEEFKIKNGSGKVKEFNYFGTLIYEGEYSNGLRQGKGKEYSNYVLRYEGEYLNGKKHGKGKEYDYMGILNCEGDYLYGEKSGFIKEYYCNGKLFFEGQYLNGK